MARSLNRVTLIGNLGQNPELKSLSAGRYVCTVGLATSDRYKDKNGEWQESTDWHNVVFWDRLAEVAAQYLKKGSKIYVEGRIKPRSYEKDGITRYVTDIVATNMIMLDKPEGRDGYDSDSYPRKSDYSSTGMDSHLSSDDNIPEEDEVPF